ncbi:hypothetical protein [Shewanella chilikensis]|uniref:hypothetical protein n=1 Tax=Shewanella chilikensis TaxID=558541 RepID=UPI0039995371
MAPRSRRYIESKQRLEAKLFKPYLSYVGNSFTIEHQINAPKHFTLELHEDYAAVLWFDIEGDQRFPVPLQWDNTRYPRLIFICPCCANKRLYLYAASNGWACRECLGLHYACQSETPIDRLSRAIRKRRRLIWGKDAELSLFEESYPIKPKGRHYRTFESDFQKLAKVETAYNHYLLKKLQSLGAGVGIKIF